MTDASEVSLGGETAKATVAKFTMAASGFVGTVVFANLLAPSRFGGYYLLFALVKIADRPLLGLASASKKRLSEAESSKSELLSLQLLAGLAWTLVGGAAAVLLSGHLRDYTGLPASLPLFVLLLATLATYDSLDTLVQATGRISAATWVDTVRSYLTLPLQVGFVLLGYGAAGMALGLAGATVLTLPVLAYVLSIVPTYPTRLTAANVWTYARHSIPTAIVGKAYDRFDIVLLGILVTPAAAGEYEVAAKLTLPAVFVAEVASSGLMARVSNLASKGRAYADDVTNTIAFASVLAIPIFFGAAAIPRPLIVTLFSPQYADAADLLVGLALYRVIAAQTSPVSSAVSGMDRPDVVKRASVIALAFNVIVGVALTAQIGALGVVVATVLAESLRYGVLARRLKQLAPDVDLLPRTLGGQVGSAVVMYAAVVLVRSHLPVDSWVDLCLLLGVGGATYAAVLLSVSRSLRITIGSVVRGSRIEEYVPAPIRRW